MRKIKNESTEATLGFRGNRTALLVMGVIVLIAAFVRVAFSVGTSVGSDFALSGGSLSTNNLYILSELVANGSIVLTDSSLYYPYGSVSTAPFLLSLVLYPFAALVNVFVSDAILASSIALAISGPLFAIATVIASYFLGKQILKSKLAGCLTALFFALCPIFVKLSVFSNGTGLSFTLFLIVLCIYFLFKAIESVGYKEGDEVTNKKAYRFSAISGLLLALVAISWVEFRAVFVPLFVVMIVQALVDRFKGKDPMPMTVVYSITLLIGALGAAVYFGSIGLWQQVASGTVFLAVFFSALVAGFSAMSKKPWTLTIPAFTILAVVILAIVAIALPDLYHVVLSGNPIYDDAYLSTMGRGKLTLSMLSTYYGAITYWFVYLAVLGMLYKFRSNMGSAPYVFTMVWLFVFTLSCGHNESQAAIATPVFAIGFAAVVCWILKNVDFKAYYSAIRTASGKGRYKRLFKPAPFVTIIIGLLLVVGPNATYVIDAAIPSNNVGDYNDDVNDIFDRKPFGALSYYIKTDETWKVKSALKDISDRVNDGALISWMDYSVDAPLYAGMKSYTDISGHGMADVSNILLSNAITGVSSAAILLEAIIYLGGITSDVKAQLDAAGLEGATDTIKLALESVDNKVDGKTIRYIVTTDSEKYGKLNSGISAKNIQYLFITNYLIDNYPQYAINQAYDNLSNKFDLSTPYVMVTGDMLPFYYGYSTVFNEMAAMNGYHINTSNYTVDRFTMFGMDAYYYGVYGFTDAMCDTLLYRTYIGMSPAEAGFTSIYQYMTALSNADMSLVMQPGYGLSNYSITYWQVMYNPSNHAESDSDGWVQMDGFEAIEKQKIEGGRINYLSGLPVIASYEGNDTGTKVTGKVIDAGAKEVRISAVDDHGHLRSTAFTDANGNYTIFVKDPSTTSLVFYAGSKGLTGGVLFDTKRIPASGVVSDTKVEKVSVDMSIYYRDTGTPSINEKELHIVITNTVTSDVKEMSFDEAKDIELAWGTYSVVITHGSDEIYKGQFTTSLDKDQGVTFFVDLYEYILTLRDGFRQTNTGPDQILITGDLYTGTVDKGADGKYKLLVPKGSYILSADNVYFETYSISVSSNGSKTIDILDGKTLEINDPNLVNGVLVKFVNDVYSTSAIVADNKIKVTLPMSAFGKTAYTVSYVADKKVHYALVEDIFAMSGLPAFTEVETKDLTGTLKNSGDTTVSGTVTLYTKDGAMFRTTANSDGEFSFYDIPKTAMLAYATNGSSEACFLELGADATTLEPKMAEATSIKPSVLWSSVYAEYLNVKVSGITGLTDYVMYLTVSTSGSYKIFVPTKIGLTIDIELAGDMYFKKDSTSAEQKNTYTLTETQRESPSYTLCARVNDLDGKNQNIKLDNDLASFGLAGDYYFSVGSIDSLDEAYNEGFSASASISYTLGKVATDKGKSGVYFADGTYYYNPFVDKFEIKLSKLLGYNTPEEAFEKITYKRVAIAGLDEKDSVKVEGDYKVGNADAEDGKEYLFRMSSEEKPLITITNEDGTEIMYRSVDLTSGAELVFDASTLYTKVTIKGFAGVIDDGTITVTYPGIAQMEIEISNGTYELSLCKSVEAEISVLIDSEGCEYKSQIYHYQPEADGTRNFLVEGFGAFKVLSTYDVTGDGAYKKVEVTIPHNTFVNTGDSGYFSISFGEAWESVHATANGQIITQLYVAEDQMNPEFRVIGYYNSLLYDLTSAEMLITLEGPSYSQYLYFDGDSPTDGIVYVNKVDDIVGDHTYSYVLEFNNLTHGPVLFNLSGWTKDVDTSKWNMLAEVLMFDELFLVSDITQLLDGPFEVYPGVTTLKITFVPVGNEVDVPKLNLVCELGTPGIMIETISPDSVSIESGTYKSTIAAEHGTAVVDAKDMDASGRGVFNDLGKMPTIVWVLFALSIILAILNVWMASKRGVFARKK